MPFDPYDQCPCGSGKKLKFCCHSIADDIDKVIRYRENHQGQAAAQVLDRLQKTHPDVPYVQIAVAENCMSDESPAEARAALTALLAKQPDHPFGVALYAAASLVLDDYEAAKPAVYRAFRLSSQFFPHVVCRIASTIGSVMHERRKYLASRQFFALALRLAPNHQKEELFQVLVEFDGDEGIPYPFRSVHVLAPFKPSPSAADADRDESARDALGAQQAVSFGCFEIGAKYYRRVAERDAKNAGVWRNIGLCHAWDADESAAAEALHRAAAVSDDEAAAIECETLAQILDLMQDNALSVTKKKSWHVDSVDGLLAMLEDDDNFIPLPLPPAFQKEEIEQSIFDILDRPEPADDFKIETPQDVPLSLGLLNVASGRPSGEPAVDVSAMEGELFDAACQVFEDFAGDALGEPTEVQEYPGTTPSEWRHLDFKWHYPAETPVVKKQAIESAGWEQTVAEKWPASALVALGGKSPREAAADPEARIPVAAAVFAFDAYCDRAGYPLDVAAVFDALGVSPPPPVAVNDELPLATLSVMALDRLPLDELSDSQLMAVVNRALMIKKQTLVTRALAEAMNRPECLERLDDDELNTTLYTLARCRFDREEMQSCLEKGLADAAAATDAFQRTMQWEVRRLGFRAEDPDDPEIPSLAQDILDKYSRKVPKIREYVEELLEVHGIDFGDGESNAPSDSSQQIWTPQDAEPAPDEAKKLWVPGS